MFPGILKLVALGGLVAMPAAPGRYRIEVKYNQTVDYTDMGGPVQESGATVTAFVTLSEVDTLGGRQASFRFDSTFVAPGEFVPPNLIGNQASTKAVVYRAMIVNGRPVSNFKTTTVDPVANLFASSFDMVFPGFRASAKVGETWVDTVATKDTLPVVREATNIFNWKVSAIEPGIMTLDATTNGTTTAVQASGEAQLVSKYVSTSTRQLKGTPGGTTTEGSYNIKQNITATVKGGEGDGQSFPVKTEHTITIKRLP